MLAWLNRQWDFNQSGLDDVKEVPIPDRFVYFLADRDLVKIGQTKNLMKRMDGFKTANPFAKLIGWIPATKTTERDLHARFRRQKVQREWFRYDGALRSYIEGLPK